MPDIFVVNAQLVGFWLQIFVTGIYYVHFPHCMSILWKKRRRGSLSLLFPVVCLLMFLIVTIELINGMVRDYHAFGVSGAKGEIQPNPTLFYADSATPLSLLKNSMIVALAIISDLIIVYRTFIVWNRSLLVIVVPVGLLCADIVYGVWSTWTLAHTPVGNTPILQEVAVRIKFFFIFTFCVNVLCSGLLCFKIWRVSRSSSAWSTSERTTSRVFEVVTETAGLYCAHLFALIVSDAVGSNVFFILLDPVAPPVTALVFSLLIVGTRTGTKMQPGSAAESATLASNRIWPSTTAQFTSRTAPTSVQGVEIKLEQVMRTDSIHCPSQREMFSSSESKVPEF
ncbi:hypothetical protein C8Q80DRAFT_1275331 [Daedaleopsis nitida]|nr:hypothetical protein C8Q80DRAFT_1275331 [Daedaleopsis nitida]